MYLSALGVKLEAVHFRLLILLFGFGYMSVNLRVSFLIPLCKMRKLIILAGCFFKFRWYLPLIF